jgi:putative glycosyltransferase
MKLSIVTTLYQSENYIAEFLARLNVALGNNYSHGDWEVILVNDGSPDDSLGVALRESRKHRNITLIDLSRNFGHHKAIMTGLARASGELVFLIDSDLEEQPEWFELFERELRANDCDVVFGVQEFRKGSKFEKISGKLFYSLINYLADAKLPKSPTVARLMTRRYVEALLQHRERELYIGGLMYLTGFKQLGVSVKKLGSSETTYSARHKFTMLVNSITSLSYKPLTLIFYLGILIFLFSSLAVLGILIQSVFFDRPLPGWASITASIWISCGLIMSSIGVLGIYISRIFSEVKQRPYTIVKEIFTSQDHEH